MMQYTALLESQGVAVLRRAWPLYKIHTRRLSRRAGPGRIDLPYLSIDISKFQWDGSLTRAVIDR